MAPGVAHAARVALAASLLLGIVYAACVAVLDAVVSARLISSVDSRLVDQVSDLRAGDKADAAADDIDATPIYVWQVTSSGLVTSRPGQAIGAPVLPGTLKIANGRPATVRLDGISYRLFADRVGAGKIIAGQSLQSEEHLLALLRDGEALAAPVLLLAMFAGAMIIGLRALSPVEQSRRRQLEFTADASHELRTPLSVISAETSVALSAPRTATQYREVLGRIRSENGRLEKIVEDLLWLARFDSAPPQPSYEPLDLATIAAGCAERFRALAATQDFDIEVTINGSAPAWISAPPEWIDRLAGVLVDNACRYAALGGGSGGRPPGEHNGGSGGRPPGEHNGVSASPGQGAAPPGQHRGKVRVGVTPHGNRVSLTVEDSGPGLPPESQDRLFDRFHRSTEQGGSAGLGLAIADSIVRSTGGQWQLGGSPLGGALFGVSWRRASLRQHSASGDRLPRSASADRLPRSASADQPPRSAGTANPTVQQPSTEPAPHP